MQVTDTTWQDAVPVTPPAPVISLWQMTVTIFKLRIVSLLLLSAFGGMALGVGAGGQITPGSFVLLTVTGTLSAAGASAINQYLERERDTKMRRTAGRPLATGAVKNPHLILAAGSAMVLGASGLALAAGQPALAFWLMLGALIYVGVYTIWLKPRTVLNIVIGGAAGSCAVISGGAAAGAWSALPVWILASLIFVWTPVHFWALALAYREDYASAAFPMLPARVSPPVAARWTALHTWLTAGFALLLGFVPAFDPIYLTVIALVSFPLFWRTFALLRTPDKKSGIRLFVYTNIYLAFVLLMIILAMLWR